MAPYAKLSISLPAQLAAEIAARGDERSGAIQRMLDRYLQALAESRRRLREMLSDAEIALILDALNGTASFDAWSPAYLTNEIADSIALDKTDAKWEIDGPALIAKLGGLSYIDQAAIVDMAERWWQRVSSDEDVQPADAFKPVPRKSDA